MPQFAVDAHTIANFRYTFARALIRVLSWLPLGAAQWLGRRVGDLLWLRPTRSRQTTLQNIALCFPDMEKREQAELARESLRHTASVTMETGMLWHWPPPRVARRIVAIEGEEHWATHTGNLAIVPHFGNWEVLTYYFGIRGDLTALYESRRIQDVDAVVRKARERFGGTLVPADRGGIKALMRALKRNELVAILPDQVPGRRSGGVIVDFFGQPALTQTLVHRLLRSTGARAIIVTAQRVPGGFHIRTDPVDDAIYADDAAVSAAAMNAAVESVIARDPAQYQWEYKRFRRSGDVDVYA